MIIHTILRSRTSNMRWHSPSAREGCGRMYCKHTPSDMGDVSKKSSSSGTGIGMGELGSGFATTEDALG